MPYSKVELAIRNENTNTISWDIVKLMRYVEPDDELFGEVKQSSFRGKQYKIWEKLFTIAYYKLYDYELSYKDMVWGMDAIAIIRNGVGEIPGGYLHGLSGKIAINNRFMSNINKYHVISVSGASPYTTYITLVEICLEYDYNVLPIMYDKWNLKIIIDTSLDIEEVLDKLKSKYGDKRFDIKLADG